MPDVGRTADGTAWTVQGPECGQTVVLIHGLGLTRETWRWHLPALAQRHRVICYDLYGHGGSPMPSAEPDLTLFSRQLFLLLDELGIDRAGLVGFSLGGMINRRAAIDHPDRVTALGILNSPHERSPEDQSRVEQQALDSASGGPSATLDAAIDRWFTNEFRTRQPDIIDEIRTWILANNPDHYALCRRVLAFGVTELIRPNIPITCPSLVITAENDSGSTPEMSRAIAAEIPGSELFIVPKLKHMGLVEDPGAFTRPLVDFLSRTMVN